MPSRTRNVPCFLQFPTLLRHPLFWQHSSHSAIPDYLTETLLISDPDKHPYSWQRHSKEISMISNRSEHIHWWTVSHSHSIWTLFGLVSPIPSKLLLGHFKVSKPDVSGSHRNTGNHKLFHTSTMLRPVPLRLNAHFNSNETINYGSETLTRLSFRLLDAWFAPFFYIFPATSDSLRTPSFVS